MNSGLPNLFNQYSVDENRVTNALLQTLDSSPHLTASFLKQFVNPSNHEFNQQFAIWSQKQPKADEDQERDHIDVRATIPDGWIVSEQGNLTVVIESKIQAGVVSLKQLRGHMRRGPRNKDFYVLLITPDKTKPEILEHLAARSIVWHSWSEIHRWATLHAIRLKRTLASALLLHSLKEFLEMFENLTEFQGINFKEGFDSRRAKVFLKDLMDKIAPRADVLYPRLKERRKGITLDRGGVWDFFGKKKFTEEVHFTISLNTEGVSIALTVPNAAGNRWRQLGNLCGNSESKTKLERVIHKVRTAVPQLWIRLEQRHFLGRRRSVQDARLDFNVDTWRGNRRSGTKNVSMWFDALVRGIEKKTSANFQLQFGARFPYTHPKLDKPEFAETVVQTLKAFKPLYSLITNRGQ